MGKSRRKRAARASRRSRSAPRVLLAVRIRGFIVGVLPVLAIFLGTRQLLAEAFRIPSGSMEPTLLVGDWLFVNKLRYGPHIPFTDHLLPGYASPKRGDVAVFISPPQDAAIRIAPDEVTPTLVKRIVGVGGDTLVMRRGQLTVNGTARPSPNTFVLADTVADQPQPIFAWQHRVRDSHLAVWAPRDRAEPARVGTARGAGRDVLHDGGQPRQFRGQPLLRTGTARKPPGHPDVRVLLVRSGARRRLSARGHGHPVAPSRCLDSLSGQTPAGRCT